jgi:hypothetical protein
MFLIKIFRAKAFLENSTIFTLKKGFDHSFFERKLFLIRQILHFDPNFPKNKPCRRQFRCASDYGRCLHNYIPLGG